MAQILDLVPWPKDGHHIGAIPAVLLPVEPRTSRLAGVKDRLYHPALPTLRQMDMDTAMNKLPDEHSRTATACTKARSPTDPEVDRKFFQSTSGFIACTWRAPALLWDVSCAPASQRSSLVPQEDFNNSTFTLVGVPNMRLPSLGMTELGRSLTAKYQDRKMAPFLPGTTQDEWPSYTCAMDDWSRFVSSAGEFRLPSINKKVLGFSYYAVRYLKPEVTQTWRYCLNQNPSLDQYGQKPIPYTSNNIFRSFGTAYSRSHYLQPWR